MTPTPDSHDSPAGAPLAPGWVTLAKYVAGDPDERSSATPWVEALPERASAVAELSLAWRRRGAHEGVYASAVDAPVDAPRALELVTRRLGLDRPRALRVPRLSVPERATSRRAAAMRWGVGIAALTAAAVTLVVARPFAARQDVQAASQEYSTGDGQRATVRLGDGSQVVLGPATTLRVTHRTVQLQGEALFTVQQNTRDPFTVLARGTKTVVLGTEFGVRAYDARVTVAVRQGKVQMNHAILSARDIGVADGHGGLQVARDRDVDANLAFAAGKLVLNNVTLAEAIPDLNRWFDADVRLGDPVLGAKLIETTLGTGSRNDLATLLEYVFRARVVKQGRTLTVYAR